MRLTFAVASCSIAGTGDRALIRDRCLSGLVDIAFIISTSGQVKRVRITSDMPAPMVRCIRNKVARWSLGGAIPNAVPYGPFRVRFQSQQRCP